MTHASPDGSMDPRRRIPATATLLETPELREAMTRLGRAQVKQAITDAQQRARRGEILPGQVHQEAVATLPPAAVGLRPMINATGVILHTNLGRASLSPAAVDAIVRSAGYVDVEYDPVTGRRAPRGQRALDALRQAVPAAEDALVVNNGAAALLLATTVLGGNAPVVVSRGEMVEIGDGFRLHELIGSTATIREVGTTNRTVLADYTSAVRQGAGCILKVHPSNFAVSGFTESVPVSRLSGLGPPLLVDIGSGLLARDAVLPDEPDAATVLADGADLVTCSGDKLLGGPQAGLVLGRADLVQRLRRHPMARALRVDKLTLAALEATLSGPETPTRAALHTAADALQRRCTRLLAAVRDGLPTSAADGARVVGADGAVGGGGAPGVRLPGWALSLPEGCSTLMRSADPPVIARVEHGRTLVDPRCVPTAQEPQLIAAVRDALTRVSGSR